MLSHNNTLWLELNPSLPGDGTKYLTTCRTVAKYDQDTIGSKQFQLNCPILLVFSVDKWTYLHLLSVSLHLFTSNILGSDCPRVFNVDHIAKFSEVNFYDIIIIKQTSLKGNHFDGIYSMVT